MQVEEVTFMTEEDHDTQMNLPNEGQKSHSNNYNVNNMNQNDKCVIFYDWLANSATTSHICNQKEVFMTYEPLTGKTVAGVGNKHANVEGRGTIELESAFQGNKYLLKLENVLYICYVEFHPEHSPLSSDVLRSHVTLFHAFCPNLPL